MKTTIFAYPKDNQLELYEESITKKKKDFENLKEKTRIKIAKMFANAPSFLQQQLLSKVNLALFGASIYESKIQRLINRNGN